MPEINQPPPSSLPPWVDPALFAPTTDPTITSMQAKLLASLEDDTLTDAEKRAIVDDILAKLLEPNLPTPNQGALETWLSKLMLTPTGKAPNAYMEPGFMVELYPLLEAMLELTIKILLQSSLLDQNMTALMLAYAESARDYALTAGEEKAQQLEKEAEMHGELASMCFTQAAMNFGTAGASIIGYASAKAYTRAQIGSEAWSKMSYAEQQKSIYTNVELVRSTISSVGTGAQNMIDGFKNLIQESSLKARAIDERERAEAESMAQFIDKLISVINQTIQKAIESGKEGQKGLESVLSMWKQFGETVSRMYQS